MDYHHYLSAHHADGSPSLLVWIWIFPSRRQGVVKHEGCGLEAEAVGSKIRPVLCLIPSPTQAQVPFTMLRDCSYRNGTGQYPDRRLTAGSRPRDEELARPTGPARGSSERFLILSSLVGLLGLRGAPDASQRWSCLPSNAGLQIGPPQFGDGSDFGQNRPTM